MRRALTTLLAGLVLLATACEAGRDTTGVPGGPVLDADEPGCALEALLRSSGEDYDFDPTPYPEGYLAQPVLLRGTVRGVEHVATTFVGTGDEERVGEVVLDLEVDVDATASSTTLVAPADVVGLRVFSSEGALDEAGPLRAAPEGVVGARVLVAGGPALTFDDLVGMGRRVEVLRQPTSTTVAAALDGLWTSCDGQATWLVAESPEQAFRDRTLEGIADLLGIGPSARDTDGRPVGRP